MKYSEQEQLVSDLRALADFYERPESIALPKPYLNLFTSVHESKYEEGEWVEDFEASKAKIKRYARALGSCEKTWGRDELRVTKIIGKLRLSFSVSRAAVCKAVVTGTERKPKQHYVGYIDIPGEYEEVPQIEWVCEETSLLA